MEFIEVIILVLSFIIFLSLGVPIAYSIGLSSILTLLVSMPSMTVFTTVAQRMGTGLDGFALLAIPFFILAGQIMNQGGIARRLIDFAKVMIGWLPGGIAHVNIIANMLFGAISGSAAAAASAIGGAMHDRMVEEGIDPPVSAAINISSATTGLIIPPSNTLIVYSLASGGVSIAALFVAGYIPGLMMGLALMAVTSVLITMSGLTTETRQRINYALVTFWNAIPSLLLLIIVIGGIIAGIFTATEASAIAVIYTLFLAFIYGEISTKDLPNILLSAVGTTSIVMILIATSMAMSWVMAFENIPQNVSEVLISFSDNPFVILLIINLMLLAVGVFMDMTPAVLIFTPIFLPVITKLGMDPIHFGIVMVMNLCIGLCTPPVGSVLFVGSAIAKQPISKIIGPLIPLFVAMVVVLMLVTYLSTLSLWLPSFFGLI
ncbi:UNVERIFIED_CONTAM: hypothetical protein GTU68_064815 [Idotea baltica]|nr:hypothetical protein [Idotea baltica]